MSYNPTKAAQVIAKLLLLNNARAINIVKVVKLVYLCDREFLNRWGLPILDESRVSMKHGPVNYWTYQHINGEVGPEPTGWKALLSDRANHMIGLSRAVSECDLDLLSRGEIEVIEAVWARFGHWDTWDLVRWTHQKENIPEWENPGDSMRPIPLVKIMEALGIDDADEASEALEDHRRIDAIFDEIRVH